MTSPISPVKLARLAMLITEAYVLLRDLNDAADALSPAAPATAVTVQGAPPTPGPGAAGPDPERVALRTEDAETIAGCETDKELEAVVRSRMEAAKGDRERRKWIAEFGNSRQAELNDAWAEEAAK